VGADLEVDEVNRYASECTCRVTKDRFMSILNLRAGSGLILTEYTEKIIAMPTDIPGQAVTDERDPLDRQLMAQVTDSRDVAAMEALYVRFKPRLMSFLRRLSTDEQLLEEAYNDIMLAVWNKSHQYEARSKVSSWIFSIAYRACLRMVKKQSRRDATIELVGDNLPEIATPDGTSDQSLDAELVQAVRSLAPKHRIVVELCYFEGYSLQEIGEIVDCPINTETSSRPQQAADTCRRC